MSKGFDTTEDLSSRGQQILDSGYGWCGRYYHSLSHSTKQKLTRAEALHLSSMGIFLVAVFQNVNNSAGYFSFSQGQSDGVSAFEYAASTIHQPAGSPVYFAVDFDATETDLQVHILPYFRGVRMWSQEYHVGVYGSGFVCRRLKELGLVSYTWLAQSSGWSEYHKYRDSKEWNILQGMGIKFHGVDVDPDDSNGNGGGFKVS